MILALLLACSPLKGLEDRWNPTFEVCDPASIEGAPDPYDLDATLSAGCQDQLLADLGADREALAKAPVTDTSPPLDACLAVSAFTLLTRDGGGFDGRGGDGVPQVYTDQMSEVLQRVGGDDNRQLSYNYTAGLIVAVTLDDSLTGGALAQTQADGLHLSPDIRDECGLELAHVLFHEAGHAVLEGHVACPDDADAACDADDQGTFSLERGLLTVWRAVCVDHEDAECVYLDQAIDASETRILSGG